MKRFSFAIASLLLSLGTAQASTICGVPFTSAQQVEAHVVKSKKAVKLRGNDYLRAFTNPQGTVAWVFVTRKSLAYPAVVCRWPAIREGKTVMLTEIRCGGKKDACDKLAAEYRDLDEKYNAQVKQLKKAVKRKKP